MEKRTTISINDILSDEQQQAIRAEVEAFRRYHGENQERFRQAMRTVRTAIDEHLIEPTTLLSWDGFEDEEDRLPYGCFYGESFLAWGAETNSTAFDLLWNWRKAYQAGETSPTPLEQGLSFYVASYEGRDNPVLAWLSDEVLAPYLSISPSTYSEE